MKTIKLKIVPKWNPYSGPTFYASDGTKIHTSKDFFVVKKKVWFFWVKLKIFALLDEAKEYIRNYPNEEDELKYSVMEREVKISKNSLDSIGNLSLIDKPKKPSNRLIKQ